MMKWMEYILRAGTIAAYKPAITIYIEKKREEREENGQ